MYEHGLDPVALSLGPISIYWYGLVYAAGLLSLYVYLSSSDIFDEALLDDYVVWAVVGMLLGSRTFTYAFWYFDQLLANPFSFFAVWQGGMSFHGAYTGLVIASFWFAQRNDLSFYKLADTLSIPMGVFLGLGRVANFVNAELVGTVTNAAWCVDFPGHDGCRHPYQLYAAAKNIVLTPVLYAANTTFSLRPGMIFWGFTWLYNVARFFLDFYRADPVTALGLSTGQLLCVGFAALASYMMLRIQLRND